MSEIPSRYYTHFPGRTYNILDDLSVAYSKHRLRGTQLLHGLSFVLFLTFFTQITIYLPAGFVATFFYYLCLAGVDWPASVPYGLLFILLTIPTYILSTTGLAPLYVSLGLIGPSLALQLPAHYCIEGNKPGFDLFEAFFITPILLVLLGWKRLTGWGETVVDEIQYVVSDL